MSYFKNEHNDSFILDIANQTIIAHAVSPQILLFTAQGLTPLTGIFSRQQALPQELLDGLLRLAA